MGVSRQVTFQNEIGRTNKAADIIADFLENLSPKFKKKKAVNVALSIDEFEAFIEAYEALASSIKSMEDIMQVINDDK